MKLENVITKNEFDDMLKEGCVLQSSGTTGEPKQLFQTPEKLKPPIQLQEKFKV